MQKKHKDLGYKLGVDGNTGNILIEFLSNVVLFHLEVYLPLIYWVKFNVGKICVIQLCMRIFTGHNVHISCRRHSQVNMIHKVDHFLVV